MRNYEHNIYNSPNRPSWFCHKTQIHLMGNVSDNVSAHVSRLPQNHLGPFKSNLLLNNAFSTEAARLGPPEFENGNRLCLCIIYFSGLVLSQFHWTGTFFFIARITNTDKTNGVALCVGTYKWTVNTLASMYVQGVYVQTHIHLFIVELTRCS